MNYNKEILENSEIKYTIDVPAEDWKKAIADAYTKTKSKFTVQGFRKGKVPMSVITSMYGVGVFFEDALDIILPTVYKQILDAETGLEPVAQPDFDIVAISDTDLKLSCLVTVKPEFTVAKYTGLKIKKEKVVVSEDMIIAELAAAQDKAGSWESVTGRPAQKFDTVVIDYSGSVGGVKFDGGSAEKQSLELGSNMFIPGFEEQVEGLTIGEAKDITVTFPAEYGADNLAGKAAVFAVKLHEIKAKSVPELNDEFAKDVSEFDTLAEYKDSIKANLEKAASEKAVTELENKVIDAIADATEINIPDAMILAQVEEMVQEFEYRLTYQGMKADDYYKYTNSSRDELKVKYNETAGKQVKVRLVMEAIIKAEKILASEDEINAKIADFAKGANKDVAEFKKTMHPEQAMYIENQISTEKLIAFLLESNVSK